MGIKGDDKGGVQWKSFNVILYYVIIFGVTFLLRVDIIT